MEKVSLHELNEYIKRVIALNLEDEIWVTCEIAQFNVSRGHAYLTLVEKDEENGQILAQSNAVIWRNSLNYLKHKIGQEFDQIVKQGSYIACQVKVDYHERYGLKLIINNIDPSFTLGKLALERAETIRQLQKEKLIEKNGSLALAPVVQRIAVISSPTAAGFKDFEQTIIQNTYAYAIDLSLFPAAMQGQNVEPEIIQQFKLIQKKKKDFDCIVIIRGGGGKMDLKDFDQLELCRAAAKMQIPILCGIGHDIDQSILDMVSHTSLKTPTAVAEFIIRRNMHFEADVLYMAKEIQTEVLATLQLCENETDLISARLESAAKLLLVNIQKNVDHQIFKLEHLCKQFLNKSKVLLEEQEKLIVALDPIAILNRGFTITQKNNKIIINKEGLNKGDEIETKFHDGSIKSTVN